MRISVVFIIIYGLSAGWAWAQEPAATDPRHSLDSLRRELDQIDRQLETGKSREKDALRDVDAASRRMTLLEELVQGQKTQIGVIRDSISILERSISAGESELMRLGGNIQDYQTNQQKLSHSLARSLLAERRLAGWSSLEFLVGARTWRELLIRRSVIGRFQETMRDRLLSLGTAVTTLHTAESAASERSRLLWERKMALEDKRSEALTMERQVQGDIADLARQKKVLQTRVTAFRHDRKALSARREEILAAQARIEEMIGKMMTSAEPLAGLSFGLLKGKLPWPVFGKLMQKFGMVKNKQLSTVTENPGIEISASQTAEVSVVADGKVSSVTWLRGFGNVCIVEHPGAYYTVYAKLGQTSVKAGEVVQSGTIIGYPGYDAAAEDYRVHFELWSGKEKKDPVAWLRTR
jgi:septal ring factor EnvC (AmiA/AmiB activator)